MIESAATTVGSNLFNAGPLSFNMQLTAWCIGASSLIINPMIKRVDLANFAFVRSFINLESVNKKEWINYAIYKSKKI